MLRGRRAVPGLCGHCHQAQVGMPKSTRIMVVARVTSRCCFDVELALHSRSNQAGVWVVLKRDAPHRCLDADQLAARQALLARLQAQTATDAGPRWRREELYD